MSLQRSLSRFISLSMIATLLFCLSSYSVASFELRTAAQNSEPKYIKAEHGEMRGICGDIIAALMSVNSDIRISGQDTFMPFKRIQLNLKAGNLDVFFCLKPTPERLKEFRFSKHSLYSLSYRLAVQKADAIQISTLDDVSRLLLQEQVLSVAGSAAERFIERKSRHKVIQARNPDVMLKMLILGRARMAFYHDLGMNYLIHKNELHHQVKLLPNKFSTYSHSVAFHRSVPDETIASIEQALQTLIDSGRMRSIHQRYGIEEIK